MLHAQATVPANWIRPGYIFDNQLPAQQATKPRRTPWFVTGNPNFMPAVMVPQKGEIIGNTLKPYPAVWRRNMKERNRRKIGNIGTELPSFEETRLGEIAETLPPGPTSERGIWGNLQSLLLSAGSIWQQNEQMKYETRAAIEQAKLAQSTQSTQMTFSSWPTIGVVISGLAIWYVLTRRD